ncbi:hypothetical protein [Nocardia salmonicida]
MALLMVGLGVHLSPEIGAPISRPPGDVVVDLHSVDDVGTAAHMV